MISFLKNWKKAHFFKDINATKKGGSRPLIDRLNYHVLKLLDKDAMQLCAMKLLDIIEELDACGPIMRTANDTR